jgi:FtsP/CotA-like multicopper oxidase with cupredoxin domain
MHHEEWTLQGTPAALAFRRRHGDVRDPSGFPGRKACPECCEYAGWRFDSLNHVRFEHRHKGTPHSAAGTDARADKPHALAGCETNCGSKIACTRQGNFTGKSRGGEAMKNLLRLSLILFVSQLAFSQAANIPVCDGSNGPNCTDYFGVANWANSPLPAGTITGYTLISGGSGYTAATVTVTDVTGVALTGAAAPTPIVVGGVISGFTGGTGGSGYTAPVVTISDNNGSGAMATAIIGPPYTGGIRKFVNSLPNLPFAVPDTVTFPGSDYYVIELSQYSQQMHSDLPPTTLRGYRQLNNGTDANGNNAIAPPAQSYLGPVIIARKNRPVRVLFQNHLPTGAGGNLFIPVDSTFMGAGAPYTQNRATLHLHGGATPWISDGTPHQWTAPAGESGPGRGDSTAFVPDMWFDGSGNVIVNCAEQPSCADSGATNDPGAGAMTFYWTNEQGGRLMFYHDHAYGITRLNVYAGEAAGYLLYDPAEESALLNATVPGTLATNAGQPAPDVAHLVPLVIQDKSFVPSKAQLDTQDPTWDGNFGATPLSSASNGNGDLWFPHVYMPNQNPNDSVGGASGFGRWDYGAWFFPPQTSLTAAPSAGSTNGITLACTSSAFPGQTLAPSASCPSCGCPIIPNPSGTPESFMDTPVVNGVAYPVLHVAPAAYRFQILNAANDRSWNMSWFLADSTQNNTEVAMLPAVPPGGASPLPLCTAVNPVAVPGLVLGLDTALLDNNGNPLNGTGLPANCWPNYGPQPGIPAPQTMWAADGRAGGAPDPRNAGPAWVQIGSEGGLLPAPAVIPATPVNYEQNVRSITIGSVAIHGLWLGPAERADVVVDFSQFAGKTLILYNDAPTPAPANDSRLDYFTGDGDQSPIGGAPNTAPGYGPNTRTIMQVVVDGNDPNSQSFSLSALKNAFASTATSQGVFAATQPTTIVPEPAYNSAYHANFPATYSSIQANTLTFNPIAPQTFDSSCGTNCAVLGHKAIQELFTLDYGRMNATLGTELPNVNFTNQTTIPLGFVDPPTEIIKQGNTQLWKITHNGVDSHFIHFHLFNVQVINRVGWDGSIRPIDANETGWKDTVRMNPLEDIVVALQPITPSVPFPIPNSIRMLDPTNMASGMFTNLDPFTNTPSPTVNANQNFGWEYVWHCHILGHEENDMMRPIIYQVPPAAPSNLVAANDLNTSGQVNLSFSDNSASETGFVVQRDLDPSFPNPVTLPTIPPIGALNGAGEGTSWGGVVTAIDNPGNGSFFYRTQAVDDGWAGTKSQSWNASILGSLSSGWSNVVSVGTAANATLSPTALAFGSLLVNTVSGSQTVTVSNASGAGTLAITGISITGINPADFSQTTNCTAALQPGASCTINVVFQPMAAGPRAGTLTVASSNPTPLSVPLAGTGIAPVISPSNNAFQFGSITVGTTTTAQTLTITNTGNSALILTSISIAGGNASDFAQTNTCPMNGAGLAPTGTCTVSMTFKPTAIGNRSSVLVISSSDPVTPVLNVSLSGFGTQSVATLSSAALTYGLQLVNTTSPVQTVALSNTGNVAYTISSISLSGNTADFVLNHNCPINGAGLSAGANCSLSVTFRPTASGTRTATVNIVTTATVNSKPAVALSGKSTQVNVSTAALTFAPQVVATQSASQQVTLTNTGPAALGITSVALTGSNPGDFTQTNNCPIGATLASGGSCRVTLRFVPTAVGVRTATVAITTNDPGTPIASVTVSGTGLQAAVSLTPTSHDFGAITARSTSAPFAFTLTNSGTASLTISRISLGGASPNRFNQTNNCGASVAIGASCTINVTFTPQQAKVAYSATLQISDNVPNSPQTATLTGTGQ